MRFVCILHIYSVLIDFVYFIVIVSSILEYDLSITTYICINVCGYQYINTILQRVVIVLCFELETKRLGRRFRSLLMQ